MSRIADALLKAGRPDGDRLETGGVALPWDLDELHALMNPEVLPPPTRRAPPMNRWHSLEFVELVQRVFAAPGSDTGVRAVTLAVVGDGAAHPRVALDIGCALAAQGAGSVCVVDASGGTSALHEVASVAGTPGLHGALTAAAPVVSVAVSLGQQMWLVPEGDVTVRDSSAASRQRGLPSAIAELADNFDFLIVQAPPLSDAAAIGMLLTIAPSSDGVVLLLDTDRTSRNVAAEVVSRLRASGVAILGAVVLKNGSRSAASGGATA